MAWRLTCYERYKRTMYSPVRDEGLDIVLHLSWFNHVLIKVVCAMALTVGFRGVPEPLRRLLEACFTGLGQTMVVEDDNTSQR